VGVVQKVFIAGNGVRGNAKCLKAINQIIDLVLDSPTRNLFVEKILLLDTARSVIEDVVNGVAS